MFAIHITEKGQIPFYKKEAPTDQCKRKKMNKGYAHSTGKENECLFKHQKAYSTPFIIREM